MANLKIDLSLTGPVIESDVQFNPDVQGGVTGGIKVANQISKNIQGDVRKRKAHISNVSGANGLKILDSSYYSGKTYVYLKNVDKNNTSSHVYIRTAQNSGDIILRLAVNDFAFFPWNATQDLWANMVSADTATFLEVYIFELAQ